MAKNTEIFPVSKDGKFIGYADASQIARSSGKLELYDEDKAKKLRVESAVAAEANKVEKSADKVEKAKATGGAKPGDVKKGPAGK